MSGKQAAANDCLSIRGEGFYAAETGVTKMMEAARPVSGAGERRGVEQRQGERAGCNEVRCTGVIRLLLRSNHQYGAGNISATR